MNIRAYKKCINRELALQTDKSLLDSFQHTIDLSKNRIYRTGLTQGVYVFPMFPDSDSNEVSTRIEDAKMCTCPI